MIHKLVKRSKSFQLLFKHARSLHSLSTRRPPLICPTNSIVYLSRKNFWNKKPLDFDPEVDYYKILEVREEASQSEIKNSYYRLA